MACVIVICVALMIYQFFRLCRKCTRVRRSKQLVAISDANTIDHANDQRSVFIAGQLFADVPPCDPLFNMQTANEAWIRRKVEVLCWKELPRRNGVHEYVQEWCSTVIDSSEFKFELKYCSTVRSYSLKLIGTSTKSS